jgi:hypothetical protein
MLIENLKCFFFCHTFLTRSKRKSARYEHAHTFKAEEKERNKHVQKGREIRQIDRYKDRQDDILTKRKKEREANGLSKRMETVRQIDGERDKQREERIRQLR